MKKFFTATMMTAMMFAAGGIAHAEEIITEARTVDGRPVKVVLDGVVDLKLKQGAPALVLSGDKRYLQKITVTQNGDTIRIGTENMRGIHIGPRNLKAELSLPQLRELVSAGVGSAEVKGFDGDEVRLSLEGAGAVSMASRFKKVDARLTGVGSMTVSDTQADVVDLNLKGAGQIAISGQSKQLNARLGGIGSLDAKQLQSDSVDADMTGLGSATFNAKTSANLRLSGMGSATVYGKPANRQSTARGMGSVSWN
ncbi:MULTISPECIES: GIN domain-containing protein [unclassified Duganella]|uniref:GIN domain-containing protein n=1 Tax=unclassified Duganella TaxID=2636909 RepID=UPI0006FAF8DA|nr:MULTISPECIES: DUF2807 domain-containing protein [unclassified Duganella]KQV58971.1 hypothetical protein ASD07_25320 [Duganella sp. Root336D2]KRC02533.1 hypothetical protein ASE26_18655 [Duganella sp. Root198D2]